MPMRHISPQMLRSAQDYAAAERSDPFALARALTHLRSGVASADARYEAEEGTETRYLPASHEREPQPYQVVVYRNMKRP